MAKHKRRPPPKRKKPDKPGDDKGGSHGGNPTKSGGSGGGTTSSGGAGTADAASDISGNPALTGATTTANPTPAQNAAADQADQDLEAFFSSGTGPAMHYSYQPGAGVGQENPSTTTGATSGGVSA